VGRDFVKRLAANHWIDAESDYSPITGARPAVVYLRRHGEHAMALTPGEARELAAALTDGAAHADGADQDHVEALRRAAGVTRG